MALKTFLLVLASSYATLATLIKECPPREATACFCKSDNYGIYLTCRRIASEETLQDSVKALRGYSVQRLALIEVDAPTVPTDLFRGLHVKELALDKFEVDDDSFRSGQTHFAGLENSLEDLFMFFSFRERKPLLNLKLDHLHSLKKIHFLGSRVPEIGNDWFANGPKSLLTLYASNIEVERLGDKAFASLINLQSLQIENNLLKEISRSMLPSPANHLQTLDLSRNRIRTLPSHIFSEMPALKIIRIDKNSIQILSESTWSSVLSQLQYLDFRDNPLQCDQDLKWVCETNTHNIYAKCTSPVDRSGLSVHDFCQKLKF